ncbi:MscS family membrane protein [Solitalea koreensis]|uniref:MscS family membrane protein n=2 Tax=Solitalea koreensis TaxID=543615 RepID=A0A521C0V5_9SPHI|nr:MscS family membrane protein [Solitalea koreensis]
MLLDFLNQVVFSNTIKTYITIAVILFVGLVFKRFISKLLSRLLFRLFKQYSGDDNAGKFVELMLKPLEFLILVFFCFVALNQLNNLNKPIFTHSEIQKIEQNIDTGLSPSKGLTNATPPAKQVDYFRSSNSPLTYLILTNKIFLLLALSCVFWVLVRILDFVAYVMLSKAEESDSKAGIQIIPFTKEVVKFIVIIFGFLVILSAVFDLNIGLIVSGLGIGGLALALAGKETVENLFAAFTIFIDKPFLVGDLVHVAGIDGTIERVGFRSTRIRTLEKSIVTIPNKQMVDNVLDNLALRTSRRVKFTLGLTYDTSEKSIRGIIDAIKTLLAQQPEVHNDFVVALDGFSESSQTILILFFVEETSYAPFVQIKERILFSIRNIIMNSEGNFAYPTQRVIHETVIGTEGTNNTTT